MAISIPLMEAASFIFCSYPSSSHKSPLYPKSLSSARSRSFSTLPAFRKFPLYLLPLLSTPQQTRNPIFQLCTTVESATVEEETAEKAQIINPKRKLFVQNLPWSFSVADIKELFGECGTVKDVEIIRKDGKSRGFAFVTMASGEEAQAALDKLDSYELSGRIIRVEFAKRFRKPSRSPPTVVPHNETPHKLYVSNLAWKVRSNHLREFFSANFNPLSARVVFDGPSGKSAGYGFVSFTTREEAESAISALDGKELLGRPVHMKVSEKNSDQSEDKEEGVSEEQPLDS